MRKAIMIGAACLMLAASATGCAKNGISATATASEAVQLKLECYLTNCHTFTDADGAEKTTMQFLIQNMDPENGDWIAGLSGKEILKTKDQTTEVYSQYLNDGYRFVSATLDGTVEPSDVTYIVGDIENSTWKEAGEEQYQAIGAIKEDGNLFLFNGSGSSVGLSGEKKFCTWLAGFTSSTVSEDGSRPQIRNTENFSIVDAKGDEIGVVSGAVSKPELIVNEYGVEVVIEATDDAAVIHAIDQCGMILKHTADDGAVTELVLENSVEESEDVSSQITETTPQEELNPELQADSEIGTEENIETEAEESK